MHPCPIRPTVIRPLGAVLPWAPQTEDGTIHGTASAPETVAVRWMN